MGRGKSKRLAGAQSGAGSGGDKSTRINDVHRKSPSAKGLPNVRSNTTIRRLEMYGKKAIRDQNGKITGGEYMSSVPEAGKVARIQPNRRWFGNTRTIGQKELHQFRQEMSKQVKDTYSVVLKQRKIPMALLNDEDRQKTAQMNLLSIESYDQVFGKKATRKRPKIAETDLSSLISRVEQLNESYDKDKDADAWRDKTNDEKDLVRHKVFEKGQSKRIWGELYKVIDASDVLVQVLDVRDPMGTRSTHVEAYMRKNTPHKHLIFVLNKCDLVPTWVTAKWVQKLSEEYPTMAFHASINNPFGKGALIQLLRQFGALHHERQQVSIGFIGYPNVGKSSIINTLRKKKVCKVAPIPGETKVWQYITLFKRIFLIDCPGVVPYNVTEQDSESEIILKGVVRIENIDDPVPHVEEVVKRVEPRYISQIYGIEKWTDYIDFLSQLAQNRGKLLKGGEFDLINTARIVLHDWQRGRLPWFSLPPGALTREEMSSEITSIADSNSSLTVEINQQLDELSMTHDFESQIAGDFVSEDEIESDVDLEEQIKNE